MKRFLFAIIFTFLITENASAKCKKEDFKNYANTNKGCIGMDYFKKLL